jgi:hypothetical protein
MSPPGGGSTSSSHTSSNSWSADGFDEHFGFFGELEFKQNGPAEIVQAFLVVNDFMSWAGACRNTRCRLASALWINNCY